MIATMKQKNYLYIINLIKKIIPKKIIKILVLLKKLFHYNDIVIFPNARDHVASLLHEYRIIKKLNLTLIGIWTDGTYHAESSLQARMKGKNQIDRVENNAWLSRLERMLISCYDYNLINVTSTVKRFSDEYKLKGNKRSHVESIRLPFSNASKIIKAYVQDEGHVKEDLIAVNTTPESIFNERVYKLLQEDLPDYRFVNFHEHEFNSAEYYRLLSKAKILISFNETDANPYNVYEAMLMGCCPILPNIEIYKKMFNENWLYNKKILKPPMLNYLRMGQEIHEKIRLIENNSLYYNMEEDIKRIDEQYFNSEDLKNILNKITCK